MAFADIFTNLFLSKPERQQLKYAKMMNGMTPIFSQFGQNVFASDLVQMCVDAIATECSKLKPRHICTGANELQQIPKSSLNRLFKFGPNPLMTTRDFIEKIIWQLYKSYNCFIYPAYDIVTDARGFASKKYTGFYPLNPTRVDFLQDDAGTLYCDLFFASGDHFTVPYSDLIHLRKKFSLNDLMGGGANGQPDNTALIKVLEVNDIMLQGIPKAIKTSLSVRGVLKIATLLDDETQKSERARLEAAIAAGDSSIVPIDLKGEFVPIQMDPKVIDKETMNFIHDRILYHYAMSVPILTGDYTDDQYQAFYEKALEPIVIGLNQAFTKTLFTTRELDLGNEVIWYQKDMMYLSTASKLNILKTVGEQGLLTDDEKLALLGYPPLTDGSGRRRTMSLNYIDVTLANEYQLTRAKAPQISTQGGTPNE